MKTTTAYSKAVMCLFTVAALACSGTGFAAAAKATKDITTSSSKTADSGALIEPSRRMRFKDSPWDYEIRVALPPSYRRTEKSYPVLWVVDGSLFFEAAVGESTSNRHIPELIVISIGTPQEVSDKEFSRRRSYDFSATKDQCSYQEPGGDLYEKLCRLTLERSPVDQMGGAAEFLEFIVNDVRQSLLKDYRLENDNTLFGYSAGGYFCTYALLTRTDAFDRYICASPNLNMDSGLAFKLEERYAKSHKDMPAKVFFSAGEGEILEGGIVSAAGLVSWTARIAEILKVRGYPSLQLHARVLPGLVHDPAGARTSLYWGLRTLWTAE